MAKKQTLEAWIREVRNDIDKETPCTALNLVHLKNNSIETEVHTCKFAGRDLTDEALASLFRGKAESYSQELPGVQSFLLRAFYEGSNEPQAFHPFTVMGEVDYNGVTGLASEGPEAKGLVAQMMRHHEVMTQMQLRQYATMFEQQNALITLLGQQATRATHESMEAGTIIKDLLATQMTSDHEFRMKEAQYERSTAERQHWLKAIPLLANTLLGREVFPQNSADTALVETILDQLKVEDVSKLAMVLPPSIMAPLMDRAKRYEQEKNKRKAIETSVTPKQLSEGEEGIS